MTVAEVETKKQTLIATMQTALAASKSLEPGTKEFDEAYQRYFTARDQLNKIDAELEKAMLAQNAEVIKADAGTIGQAIFKLIEGLKVAEKTGKPIQSLKYFVDGDNKPNVVFNPVTTVKSSGGKATGAKKTGKGHTKIHGPGLPEEGESITKFVIAHLTESQKTEGSADFVKYPHVLIDTKPKFEAFCVAHGLTGYTYDLPTASEEAGS